MIYKSGTLILGCSRLLYVPCYQMRQKDKSAGLLFFIDTIDIMCYSAFKINIKSDQKGGL